MPSAYHERWARTPFYPNERKKGAIGFLITERSLPSGKAAHYLGRQLSRSQLSARASTPLILKNIPNGNQPWFLGLGQQRSIVSSVAVRTTAYPRNTLKKIEKYPTTYEPKVDDVVVAVMEQAKAMGLLDSLEPFQILIDTEPHVSPVGSFDDQKAHVTAYIICGDFLVQSFHKSDPRDLWFRHHFYTPADPSYWTTEFKMSPVRRPLDDDVRDKLEASKEVYNDRGLDLRRAPTTEEAKEARFQRKKLWEARSQK